MARRDPSRRTAARSRTPAGKRPASSRPSTRSAKAGFTKQLSSLVSALKANASRKQAAKSRSSHSAAPPALPRVKRVSVVKKPSRSPTVRAARAPARRPSTPAQPFPAPSAAAAPQAPASSPEACWTPSAPLPPSGRSTSPEEAFSIPTGYGEDRIVLMVKDPWWLFAYWEIQPATERAARTQLPPQDIPGLESVLRVYDVTGMNDPAQPANSWMDISLSGLATNWYLNTNAPGGSFLVEIGLRTAGGRFILLARSNRVTAPRFGPSDLIDEQWAVSDEDFWKLLGPLAGFGPGSSPMAWARLAAHTPTSGHWGSLGTTPHVRGDAMLRGIWCRVDTDLVLHGATEPRASVTVQGQPVAVRHDGTFSVRITLPEGTQTVTIEVVSLDGRRTRTVTPIVSLAWRGGPLKDTTPATAQVKWTRPRAHSTGAQA